ncbi:related to acid beta-fructofuranosidase precursor [Rhynchosporium agropyri]|uniref:Related to acid beta-fructofuranosidase n=1 Tax=Rhynchosporium agropyri TaxID=914238 RepID=A0A1E1KH97_9HELO|nr:related to acid beta-fructofuranosidase precursor [Rhynchosporium agropyri]
MAERSMRPGIRCDNLNVSRILSITDGVFWEHDGDKPVLWPTLPYDKEGIFTGCVYPTAPDGKPGQLTAFYTSVCSLPFHWTKPYPQPYPRDAAGLTPGNLYDGGTTWQKSEQNLILAEEPEGLIVTGFRDPYMAAWPAMDNVRGKTSLYGTISGGIRDQDPKAFLYAIDPNDMSKWEHIGSLLELPVGHSLLRKWGGDFGVNWKYANIMTLKHGSEEREFAIIGSEGGLQREHLKVGDEAYSTWCMRVAGKLQKQGGIWMEYEFSGVLDHGCFYAANSFDDPRSGKRIVWGWLQEEDLTLSRREAKGWTGHLSLQRELSYHKITNVVRAIKTPLSEITSIHLKDDDNGTKALEKMAYDLFRNSNA